MTSSAMGKRFGSKEYMIIIFLMISGFILRIHDLGTQSFWIDEAISSIAAIAFLDNGSPVLPSGVLYSRGILNTSLIALSFKIFGFTEFAARIPSVLFGTLTISLAYLIGSRWGNARIGVIAAVLVAFSVWEIAWSRQARMYQQLQFFYLLSLYLFYELSINKSLKWLVLLVLSVIGAILSHVFGYVLILVFLAYLAISVLKERRIEDVGRGFIAMVMLACTVLFGIAYRMGVVSSVLETAVNYYDVYIYLFKKDLGIFLFMAVPGGTVLANRDWKKGLLLIAALVIPLYFIFYHVHILGTRYLYLVIPILFILIGYFLDFVVDYLSSVSTRTGQFHNISVKTVANVIVAFLLISAMYFSPAFTFTPRESYDLGVNAPQPDFKSAYRHVRDNMEPDDAIVSAWAPPAQFYLGKSDYWLAFNVVGTGMEEFLVNNSSREIYTNATAITDVETFRKVVDEYDRGWVVVDGTAWYKLRPSIRDFIGSNLTLYVTTGKRDVIKVYRWTHSEN